MATLKTEIIQAAAQLVSARLAATPGLEIKEAFRTTYRGLEEVIKEMEKEDSAEEARGMSGLAISDELLQATSRPMR